MDQFSVESKNSALRRPIAIRIGLVGVLLALLIDMAPSAAFAHATERAFILLLPTGYYLLGGTLAVGVTFAALRFIPARLIAGLFAARWKILSFKTPELVYPSLLGAVMAGVLLIVGWLGPRDPLENALPVAFWTLFWVGLTLAHAVFGNLWHVLNPLRGADCAVECASNWVRRRLFAGASAPAGGPTGTFARYPEWLGYWPAIVGFAVFAWFELVYPAPEDPDILAGAIALYGAINLVAMRLFGRAAWLQRAEAFSVFFGIVAGLAPVAFEQARDDSRRTTIALAMPGAALAKSAPSRLDFALFVLLALASVSFDGLSRTFFWLTLAGVNPLEFPGRSAMVGWNTWGLFGTYGVLACLFFTAEGVGRRLGGAALSGWPFRAVVSLAPISLGFHAAHYLTTFLVNVQYAAIAATDPFGLGWNLLGIADSHVSASFLNNREDVNLIWNMQAAAVVAGHLLAVVMAQGIGVNPSLGERANWRAQAPLAALMVGYTWFGLWLLSTPVAG